LAVVFGASESQTRQLVRRLERLTPEHSHPLIISGIFFELERARLEECVDELLDNFALKPSDDHPLDLDMSKVEMADYLKSCYRSRELENEISGLKRQIRKMIRETTKLEKSISKKKSRYNCTAGCREQLQRAGQKIKSRLEEVCDTLDDKINDCNVTISNMSITMHTVR
jgi:septation ring formation regulator EzrA